MLLLQILSLIFWLLVVPFGVGLLLAFLTKEKQCSCGTTLLFGYIGVFVLLELIGVPIVLIVVYHGFTTFCWWFGGGILLAAVLGAVLTVKRAQRNSADRGQAQMRAQAGAVYQLWTNVRESLGIPTFKQAFAGYKLEERMMFVLFLLLVGFQMYMAFTRASFDGDDAYYGVQALTAQQIDVLYRIDPNNGWSTTLDVRHALALFPIWEAFIGQVSGIHATIVCHSIIPLVLLPLTYVLYFQIGKALFPKRKDIVPMFMVIIALWQMFGNISIYTNETFFLTRTWQGKSFAGNFVIPAVFWLYLKLFPAGGEKKEGGQGLWFLLAGLNLAGGASSSLAVLLSCLLTVGLGVLFALREKKFSILLKAGFACVTGGGYVFLYLLLTHGFIRL